MSEKMGIGSLRINKTTRPLSVEPELNKTEDKTLPTDTLLNSKQTTSKSLAKSIRISSETHTAISTIATIEDKKIYEVIEDMVNSYIQSMPSPSRKNYKR
ncbi:hypothetical protein [Vagococcus xieshaowenii]|uniref:Uncharacterized protein n=1 Tax=Vagococcus xieshaowenii TaxID=2562451 RepID=A0ABX5TJP9_9ENTE|nr:hypothetical protein [Vagococcus xieshaowenii]QCA29663.1 hypothetical protein E4Z98_09760 [Vagococcus xieshaowenii]